ncbi:hypothetical protein E8E13_003906 [Curvularia kusanoi]|uniref:Uncharacterized protein n=1 Tax=Curvularia kusanoi TaxID=90978 RepID=A0A9P4W851_CURKU|nr:hypothetical protein E8E13_003906 [Curvularia kusanoi]
MENLEVKRARRSVDKTENQSTKRRRCGSHENDETQNAIGVDKATDEMSPLLRLPGELRNQIYGYLTVDRRPFFCPDNYDYSLDYHGAVVLPHESRNLSQSNRQLRGEVKSYVLHSGKFCIKYRNLSSLREVRYYTVDMVELNFI